MREIKFRVWHFEKEAWIENEPLEGPQLLNNIFSSGQEVYQIQQYTGMKDRNGKEIYEGDIIKREIGLMNPPKYYFSYVVWYKTEWRTYGKIYKCCGVCDCQHPAPTKRNIRDFEYAEVIGNIYQNPELLKN